MADGSDCDCDSQDGKGQCLEMSDGSCTQSGLRGEKKGQIVSEPAARHAVGTRVEHKTMCGVVVSAGYRENKRIIAGRIPGRLLIVMALSDEEMTLGCLGLS